MIPVGSVIHANMRRLLSADDVVKLGLGDCLLDCRPLLVPIPIEIVINPLRLEIIVQPVARAFHTRFCLAGLGAIQTAVNLDDLQRDPGFKGSMHETEILLVEFWVDWGSDGHVEFQMDGWILMPETEWKMPDRAHYGQFPDVRYGPNGIVEMPKGLVP